MLDTALRLIQAEQIAKRISQSSTAAVQIVPPVVPAFPVIKKFTKPDQTTLVPAAASRYLIFEYRIRRGSEFGVLRRVANDYWVGDDLLWLVDNQPVEERPIQRVIATHPNSPLSVVIPFYDRINWYVNNNDTQDHLYSILNDGYVGRLRDRDRIMEMVSRGAL